MTTNDDRQQVDQLCKDLSTRMDTLQTEQVLLEQLVETSAPRRLFRARQYQLLLDETRERAERLKNIQGEHCQ